MRRGVRRRVLPIVDSYLLWSFFLSAARGLGWFAGLFLAFAVVSSAKRVAQEDLSLILGLQAIALQIPRMVLFTIPAALLFGAVSTFVEMSSKGETTAMMAGGMSVWRLMRAPLLLSVALALFAFWLQEAAVPGAELQKGNLLRRAGTDIAKKKGFKIVDTRDNGSIERVVQAKSFDPENNVLIEPRIQIYRLDNTVETEIKAQTGQWNEQAGVWRFKTGSIRTNPERKDLNSVNVPFSETDIRVAQMIAPQRLGGDFSARDQIEKNNFEMVSWQQLTAYRAEKIAELPKLPAKERERAEKKIHATTYGIHDKWALPFTVIAMVLVGIPLGIRPQRTASPGMAMGLSLMVMLSYYLFWTICAQFGKMGFSFAALFAWLPLLVLLGFGLLLLKKKS